ncbi:unnamed protein product [Acanthoscelides obtectus]|uniref:Uncharacterized protein n=1 Tax=Acanthoscelides obtectus TaxID=200917 RepID=A0A9P0QBD8_ACAOB|nr:unnamed protein product [Acanthoscelides obtectus]CAK1685483.1 hypothetical protein AOBTE_LOCUS35445 [Acanthoscelides obtectus]
MKICLCYLGDPGYQQGIGQEIGVSQAMVCRIMDRVVNSIVTQSNEWIKFPTTNHELMEVKRIWYCLEIINTKGQTAYKRLNEVFAAPMLVLICNIVGCFH